jgi:molybdate transport system ATP-binding protein
LVAAPWLSFDDVTLTVGDHPVFAETNWTIARGEQWAIIGTNGSGKSLLVEAIRGRRRPVRGRIVHHFLADLDGAEDAAFGVFPRGTLAVVSTADLQQLASAHNPYVQARWHGSETGGHLTVTELLDYHRVLARHPFEVLDGVESSGDFAARRTAALARFGLAALAERQVMQLSNGELRKLLLVRALLLRPRLLILDEPFVGLDVRFRRSLTNIIRLLMHEGVAVLLVTARGDELPDETTHVAVVHDRRLVFAGPREHAPRIESTPTIAPRPPRVPRADRPELTAGSTLVALRDVTVRYGTTTVLDRVGFTMKGDESWAILGPNGSGKSTLLSLVLADNPQAYANDVRLFGRRRGTGESIWDVKAKLGWMGADLHALYPRSTRSLDVVCSGWFHSIGLYRRCSEEQRSRALECLAELGVATLAEVPLGALAHGEQRLVLLARALVQRPLLLVLDEPCQGLDAAHRSLVLDAVDAIVEAGQSRVLFVTHHHDELPSTISHVLHLSNGRVASAGPRAVLADASPPGPESTRG